MLIYIFVVVVVASQAKTLMGPDNLAVVFCPNLLRGVSTDPREIMRNSQMEHGFVKNLILHADKL